MATPIIVLRSGDTYTQENPSYNGTSLFVFKLSFESKHHNNNTIKHALPPHPFIGLGDKKVITLTSHTKKATRSILHAKSSFWSEVSCVNWCYSDFDFSGFNAKKAVNRMMKGVLYNIDIFCTCYYYVTMAAYGMLQPLREKYEYTEDEYIGIVSHIVMMGKNWFAMISDDISIVEPIFSTKKYINFHELFMGKLHNGIEQFIMQLH